MTSGPTSTTDPAAVSDTRALADALAATVLAADPFLGTELGLRDYDALVPDPSPEAEDRFVAELAAVADQVRELKPSSPTDVVTRDLMLATCASYQHSLALHTDEFTVTAMPFSGPAALLVQFARAVLVDPRAATDYLERLRGSAGWIDAITSRLRDGRAKGRVPVGALVDQAIAWSDSTLAEPVPAAVMAPAAPDGWDEADSWQAEVADTARNSLVPALRRWREEIVQLRGVARADADVGLSALPGGAEDYERAIILHTTLPYGADELHRIGLDAVARIEARILELGAGIGLGDLTAIRLAARASAGELDPAAAMDKTLAVVRRAESRAGEMLPPPLPPPCAVTPMPPSVADSGIAPHYTLPREDGSRPGTYWFNTRRPTAGTGWDLEAVTFHESVPGHHLQLARVQQLTDLPRLHEFVVTAHAEGWGLYAERLAGEFGLYSDAHAEIGAAYAELMRAARLVVDTGLHARGWSRERARVYYVEHLALPEAFLHNEIDRYIAVPGQALAYLVGQREILRLRETARDALGDRFDLPSFNAAVLDSGSLPMPVLANVISAWIATGGELRL